MFRGDDDGVKALLNTTAPIGSRVDVNHDGRVNALPPPPAPATTPAAEGATALVVEARQVAP